MKILLGSNDKVAIKSVTMLFCVTLLCMFSLASCEENLNKEVVSKAISKINEVSYFK